MKALLPGGRSIGFNGPSPFLKQEQADWLEIFGTTSTLQSSARRLERTKWSESVLRGGRGNVLQEFGGVTAEKGGRLGSEAKGTDRA